MAITYNLTNSYVDLLKGQIVLCLRLMNTHTHIVLSPVGKTQWMDKWN